MRKYLRLLRRPASKRQRAALRLASRVFRDDRGAQVMEYALVIGLVIAGAIGVITCVGIKVLARWNSVNSKV